MLTVLLGIVVAAAASALIFVAHAWYQEHRPDRIPVLLYHRFLSRAAYERGEIQSAERTYVAFDDDFAAEMQALRDDGYTPIDLDEYADALDGKRPFPNKGIVITIDDGFRSVYLHAFPILRRLGMKAVFFVTPDKSAYNFTKNAATDQPATDAELREMSEAGIAIESHGMTHRYLTTLDDNTIRWEMEESRRVLTERFGRPVRHLAIPSGAYDRRVRGLVATCGYRVVFASRKGTNHAGVDRLAMRRLVVGRGFGAAGLRHLLRPSTAFQLRLASGVQNAVQSVIGTGGLDKLRLLILRLPFGPALIRRPIRLLAAGLGVVLLAAVAAAFLLR
ncbi:MAG TPA: polysaccharide deacetylase family protein [Candidatus Polarisedimenticolia bacterium]|jgi:peptidoglycan/xylan/chitin deacetylase (PgdA/CDA1 family)|nr:polysaccharide deacetylase family protein [Candidatus Polarisedimenticolia bacterium]